MQIVRPIVAWVTAGFTAPGVQRGSGITSVPWPEAWQEPAGGWGCTSLPDADETGRRLGER